MAEFHIDEPREIGKKKDRLSSREKNMIKLMRVEELLKKKFKTNEELKTWLKEKLVKNED